MAACSAGAILGLILFPAWSKLSLPALYSMAGQALPVHQHAMGTGLAWLIKWRPIMIGPITGGIPRDRLGLRPGFRAGVLMSILLGLGALALQSAACYIPSSHLADRYGREPFLIATFVFFTLFPLTLLAARRFAIDKQGRIMGAYCLARDTIVTTGSFIGAALCRPWPKANFAGPGLLGGIRTRFCIRSLLQPPDSSKQTEFGC